jgi:hypothetical protein
VRIAACRRAPLHVNNFSTLARKVHGKQFKSDVDDARRRCQQGIWLYLGFVFLWVHLVPSSRCFSRPAADTSPAKDGWATTNASLSATTRQGVALGAPVLQSCALCNKIGPEQTCQPRRSISAIWGEAHSTRTSRLVSLLDSERTLNQHLISQSRGPRIASCPNAS